MKTHTNNLIGLWLDCFRFWLDQILCACYLQCVNIQFPTTHQSLWTNNSKKKSCISDGTQKSALHVWWGRLCVHYVNWMTHRRCRNSKQCDECVFSIIRLLCQRSVKVNRCVRRVYRVWSVEWVCFARGMKIRFKKSVIDIYCYGNLGK